MLTGSDLPTTTQIDHVKARDKHELLRSTKISCRAAHLAANDMWEMAHISLAVWTFASLFCLVAVAESNGKPNVIIMLMDDVSFFLQMGKILQVVVNF